MENILLNFNEYPAYKEQMRRFDGDEDSCLLAIFGTDHISRLDSTWYVGAKAFKDKYVVFDATPATEGGHDFI